MNKKFKFAVKDWDLSSDNLFERYDKLGTEEDMLDEIVHNAECYEYLGDGITEMVDSFIPIYTNELWELAPDIRSYIEQGIEEFDTDNVDLVRIFQQGVYLYLTEVAYSNEDLIKENIAIMYLMKSVSEDEFSQDELEEVLEIVIDCEDYEDIIDMIEDYLSDKFESEYDNQ